MCALKSGWDEVLQMEERSTGRGRAGNEGRKKARGRETERGTVTRGEGAILLLMSVVINHLRV